MQIIRTYQSPLQLGDATKREARTQFAALCYRMRKSKHEILLVTSIDRKRWIIPKGWPMDGLTPGQAAAQEAWEEAGVRGRLHETCIGLYSYHKSLEKRQTLPIVVAVFPVEVKRLEDSFPEAKARRRKWFSPKKAAARVEEPELRQILREFDPSIYR